jgi:alkylhydroperoxidase/carboxymuconolactone decarboxylase family protein YurZ
MGRWDQVANHCESFLLMGGTLAELKALFVHLSVYCGWPATLSAHRVLQETVKAKKLSRRLPKRRRTLEKRK